MSKFDFNDTIKNIKPDMSKYMNVAVLDQGHDIYAYEKGMTWGYRYGPTMMNYADGSMDVWFASPGSAGLWDYFTYKSSDDGGKTWGHDKIVMQPTPDTMDYPSVCDPSCIYFGGYYYLGYTSTVFSGGVGNNLFVGRSRHPDGPYEKWDGTGWGGDPAPIVYYTDDMAGFGAGEPSFVEVDGTLYIYYTWVVPGHQYTYVATADATIDNWPETIQYRGMAMERSESPRIDSPDVKYVENYGKFLAVTAHDRMNENSGILFWESNDGITFHPTNLVKTNIICHAHNPGMMGRPNGHINLNDKLYFAYAYGGISNDWGKWSTRIHEFKIVLSDTIDKSDVNNDNRKVDVECWENDGRWTLGLTTKDFQHFEKKLSQGSFDIEIYWFDTNYREELITDSSKICFCEYDKSIIDFDGLKCIPKQYGDTYVTAIYDGVRHVFKVSILPDDALIYLPEPEIVKFSSALIYPCTGPIVVNKDGSVEIELDNKRDRLQIRSFGVFNDRNWMELFNNQGLNARFWTQIHYRFDIAYRSSDESVLKVDTRGMVEALGRGTAIVTVTCGSLSYDVKITVK